jgi:hypothetical protein
MGRQQFDFGERLFQLSPGRIVGGIIGMQGHGPKETVVLVHGLHSKTGGLKVTPHLDGSLDAHRSGCIQGGPDPYGRLSIGKVEVGVVVHDGYRQGFRGRRELPLPAVTVVRGILGQGAAVSVGNQRIAHPSSLTVAGTPIFVGTLCQVRQLC